MRTSLQKQVLYRLLTALLASGLIVIAATVWFQSRALEGAALSRRQDIIDHFQGRMADLNREWENHAIQLKQNLEFSRVLESRRSELLNAFFLAQSSNADFSCAIIADSRGERLLQYGVDKEMRESTSRITARGPWFYHQSQKTLYHVFTVPIWLGKTETGTLYLLKPMDHALLGQIAYPHTDLYLLLDGRPVAASLGGKGFEQFADVDGKASVKGTRYAQVAIPWSDPGASGGITPVLVVRTQIRDSLSGLDVVMIVLASLVVLAVASWRVLGAWINGIIGDIVALNVNSDTFSRERKAPAPVERSNAGERVGRKDELGELTTGMTAMMQTVLRSERLYQEALDALRRANELKTAVVDTVDAMVVLLDTRGRIVSFNKACERATGFASRDVVGTCLWDSLIPPNEVERTKGVFHSLVSGQFPGKNENYWLTRDGGKRLIAWSNTALLDQSGAIEYVLATGIDITESRAAEQALKQSEEKFRTIFNAANDVIFIHDIETGAVVDINRKVREMYGYHPDEVLKLGANDLCSGVPPYSADDAWRWLQKAAAGEPQLFEWRAKDRFGRLFWVEVNMRRARIGADDRIVVTVRDITDSLRAEKDLILFRTLVDQSNDAFFVADPDSAAILDVNGMACSSLGYTRAELLGLRITDIANLAYDDASWQARMKLIKKKGALVYESVHQRKDRTLFPVELSVRFLTQEGKPYLIGVARDITERKKTERELRIKDNAIATAISGIAISDMEGRITYANRAYIEMLGYADAGEVLGRPLSDFAVSAAQSGMIREVLKSKGSWIGEMPGKRKDGTCFPRLLSASMVFDSDGKPISVLGSFLDITVQKETMSRVEESERKFRAIFEAARDGMIVVSRDSGIVMANKAFCGMLGYRADEMTGFRIPDIHPPQDQERVASDFTLHARGEKNFSTDMPVMRKDGSVFYADISSSLFAIGSANYIVGAFRDATDRRQAEGKVLAALAEKELLLKEIHHRVKNNLQIIASLLYLQAEEVEDPKTRELLRESRDRIKSMALVHEKLYGARDLSRIDFADYCENLGTYLFSAYGAAKRDIHLETLGSGIYLEVDTAIPCGLIVSELLSNSLKYAYPGGRRGTVRVTASLNDAGDLELTIGDDGVGLPPDLAFGSARTLGLRLVHKLTAQLHGTIIAASDNGAVFRMTIPLRGRKRKDPVNG